MIWEHTRVPLESNVCYKDAALPAQEKPSSACQEKVIVTPLCALMHRGKGRVSRSREHAVLEELCETAPQVKHNKIV